MPKHIDSHKHSTDKRAHIPSKEEAGYEEANPKVQEGNKVLELPKNPVVHRGQDPELFWLGKYGNDDRDELLKTDIRSLYRHEHIAPETLIKNLYKVTETQSNQMDLFSINELFGNALDKDEIEKVSEYYAHQDGWTNRLIQGDSHLVMASLLEREGMAGQVQTIYIDPPYGIKYGGNWQIKLNNRDVKDGSDEALTSEPEQIKAFRDTWELGIHSYLSYLRDRLLIAKELLNDTGSCFVQISDENVHLVRSVMDEVFGSGNFVSLIKFRKKTMPLGAKYLEEICDFIIWYGKDKEQLKYTQLFQKSIVEGDSHWNYYEMPDGKRVKMTFEEINNHKLIPKGADVIRYVSMHPIGYDSNRDFPIEIRGKIYTPAKGKSWKTDEKGFKKLLKLNRIEPYSDGKTLNYILKLNDYPVSPLNSMWSETSAPVGIQYVVETNTEVIKRCLLMTSDPGDLVLDPTCVRAGTRVWAYSPLPPMPPEEEVYPPMPPEEEVYPPLPPKGGNLLTQISFGATEGSSPPFGGQGGTSLLPIESLHPGDTVLAHDGKPHTILRTIQKTYTGKMIGIQHSHSDTLLWLTADHKVLCKKRSATHKEARYMQNVYSPNFDRAKKMRKGKTLPEQLLWDRIRANQMGVTFRQQRTIGRYIVDFFAIENDLIIEIDGEQHNDPQAQLYDKERDAFFQKIGLETWRIPAKRVIYELPSVLEELKQRLQAVQKSDIKDVDWRMADTLQVGDMLYFSQGKESELREVSIIALLSEETKETVYDLEVEGAHSFVTEVCAVHNCGSGTTAFVAEQWGRRWITIDTSRIALNIAKQRLMTATFPYYKLYDEKEGDIRQGFVYKTVPHITLKSLANDEPPATETLYDQPESDKKRMRVSGPFTVETLQSYEPISPDVLAAEKNENETSGAFEEVIKQHLLSAGIKNGRKDEMVVFRSVELLADESLHAEGFYLTEKGEQKAYFHIGPKFGSVSKQFVNKAIKECRLRGDANWLIILGFSFESDIEGSTQTTNMGMFEVTKVRIHDDLLQEGLKKKPAKSAASFVTIGEPDIAVVKNGSEVQIEIKGLDIYDPIRDEVKARNIHEIAYWMIDEDYDDSNFVVKQVFFCGGDKSEFEKWKKGLDSLAKENTKKKVEKTLKIEIDEDAFERLYGHVSHPIPIKRKGQKVAVRIISQFGEECTKVLTELV